MLGDKVDLGQHQAIKDLLHMKDKGMSREDFEKKHSSYIGEVPSWDQQKSRW